MRSLSLRKRPTASQNTESPKKKQHRGFAAMDPKKASAIASLGGKAAHAKGTAHEYTTEEARAAGRLGGLATAKKRWGFVPSAIAVLMALAAASCTPASPKESGLCPCPGCCGAVSK